MSRSAKDGGFVKNFVAQLNAAGGNDTSKSHSAARPSRSTASRTVSVRQSSSVSDTRDVVQQSFRSREVGDQALPTVIKGQRGADGASMPIRASASHSGIDTNHTASLAKRGSAPDTSIPEAEQASGAALARAFWEAKSSANVPPLTKKADSQLKSFSQANSNGGISQRRSSNTAYQRFVGPGSVAAANANHHAKAPSSTVPAPATTNSNKVIESTPEAKEEPTLSRSPAAEPVATKAVEREQVSERNGISSVSADSSNTAEETKNAENDEDNDDEDDDVEVEDSSDGEATGGYSFGGGGGSDDDDDDSDEDSDSDGDGGAGSYSFGAKSSQDSTPDASEGEENKNETAGNVQLVTEVMACVTDTGIWHKYTSGSEFAAPPVRRRRNVEGEMEAEEEAVSRVRCIGFCDVVTVFEDDLCGSQHHYTFMFNW